MMNQGQQAVNNSASSTGGVNSGNTLKALTQYGQGLANQTYQQYLGNVSGLANTGLQAANAIGNFGQNTASEVGGNTIGAGNALAAGTVGGANSLNTGLGSLGTIAQQLAFSNQLKGLTGGGSGGGGYFGNIFGSSGGGVPAAQIEPTVPAQYGPLSAFS